MKRSCSLLLVFAALFLPLTAQPVQRFEQGETLTYDELIAAYRWLSDHYDAARLLEAGTTDAGRPLHLFVITGSRLFDPVALGRSGRPVILINNGIHPGEPDGMEASLLLARALLDGTLPPAWHDSVVVAIIPVYNVGGMLQRSPYHRANQSSPRETGFRGNARHLDLNRDFVKADSRNARSLERLFTTLRPLVFLDTHTTNGSDHRYTITLIPTMYQKMDSVMGTFFHRTMVPALYGAMSRTPYPMTPYVDPLYGTPERGIVAFNDLPRYSTGYASLFNTFAFMTENHVYKPFADRVRSAYLFMQALTAFTVTHGREMMRMKQQADRRTADQKEYVLSWQLDTTRYTMIPFLGYRMVRMTGAATGLPYRWYDREQPCSCRVRYYDHFVPDKSVQAPAFYILPQAWEEAVRRLRLNGIRMYRLMRDTTLTLTVRYITGMETGNRPYNGHYRHRNIRCRTTKQKIPLYRGDLVIPVDQSGNRYLIQTLEPEAPDAFLAWNFFDPILERREYFSPATFEERAAEILARDTVLRRAFEARRRSDSTFAADRYNQLLFIYSHSPWQEDSWMRVPVYRLEENTLLPLEELPTLSWPTAEDSSE